MTTQPPVSFAALRNALSDERLRAYATPQDVDEFDAVARYFWNLSLTLAIQPALHALEITFRNHLFSRSTTLIGDRYKKFKEVSCWLDADPTPLEEKEAESVEHAKRELRMSRRPRTPGRLVSKLGFGFWVSLCKRPYEQGRASGPALWPGLLATNAFPHLPAATRSRQFVFESFDALRGLRNRVSHHEPIWDHDLAKAHDRIIGALGWMNQGLAEAVKQASPLVEVVTNGPAAFRSQATSFVRS